jgi:hypothetical protein
MAAPVSFSRLILIMVSLGHCKEMVGNGLRELEDGSLRGTGTPLTDRSINE